MFGPMIVGLALIEAMVIYALVMFFVMLSKLPEPSTLKPLIEAEANSAQVRTQANH
jgi:hypothetical protein